MPSSKTEILIVGFSFLTLLSIFCVRKPTSQCMNRTSGLLLIADSNAELYESECIYVKSLCTSDSLCVMPLASLKQLATYIVIDLADLLLREIMVAVIA